MERVGGAQCCGVTQQRRCLREPGGGGLWVKQVVLGLGGKVTGSLHPKAWDPVASRSHDCCGSRHVWCFPSCRGQLPAPLPWPARPPPDPVAQRSAPASVTLLSSHTPGTVLPQDICMPLTATCLSPSLYSGLCLNVAQSMRPSGWPAPSALPPVQPPPTPNLCCPRDTNQHCVRRDAVLLQA